MNILQGVLSFAEHVIEFLRWREDWNRTWSPVSYWLAVAMFAVLVLVGLVYAQEAWRWLNTLVGRV